MKMFSKLRFSISMLPLKIHWSAIAVITIGFCLSLSLKSILCIFIHHILYNILIEKNIFYLEEKKNDEIKQYKSNNNAHSSSISAKYLLSHSFHIFSLRNFPHCAIRIFCVRKANPNICHATMNTNPYSYPSPAVTNPWQQVGRRWSEFVFLDSRSRA